MIKITNLNKYFNKNKNNEIHVLNNVSLELPDYGFVTILGASGSGKSTLLNVIGGLDKYESGNIEYSNITDTKKEIGFVFQNYLLLDNYTVYENLRQALEIIGINDEAIQEKRIKYVLSLVNMSNFERKKCINLSGGEKQRISIARALLKQSSIILADEPTGNLDSENTLEIMNILKTLSKSALVILVTHEENLAYCYSDRIISFKDGQLVNDQINNNNGNFSSLEVNSNNKIYLQDFDKKEYQNDDLALTIYSDNSLNINNLKLIIKNNTVYISTPYKTIDVDSNRIELLDSKSIDFSKEFNNFTIDETVFFDKGQQVKKKNNFFKNFIRIFKEILNTNSKMSSFLRIVFLILGAVCAGLVISYTKFNYVNYDNVYQAKDLSILDQEYYHYYSYIASEDIVKAYEDDAIGEVVGTNYLYLSVDYKTNLISSQYANVIAYSSIVTNDMRLISGRLPKPGMNEAVISKKLYNSILEELDHVRDEIDISMLSVSNSTKVVGVVDTDTNLIYYCKMDYYNTYGSLAYDLANENYCLYNDVLKTNSPKVYKITDGVDLSFDNTKHEIILNKELGYQVGDILDYVVSKVETIPYEVVGLFEITDLKTNPNYVYFCYDNLINGCTIEENYLVKSNDIKSLDYLPIIYFLEDAYEIIEGTAPKKVNEILVNENSGYKVGDVIKSNYEKATSYTVTGLYKSFNLNLDGNIYPINNAVIVPQVKMFAYKCTNYGMTPTFIKNSNSNEYFKNLGYDVITYNQYTINAEKSESSIDSSQIIILVLIILIILYTYFTIRAKMINDIRIIGTRLAVGESKGMIIKYYLNYSIILTLISSALGYFIVGFGYIYISLKYPYLFSTETLKTPQLIIGFLMLFGINIVVSLLPCLNILKNTPARILSKYDI